MSRLVFLLLQERVWFFIVFFFVFFFVCLILF